ncbi:glycosyltransferase [Nonomuraea zeae]|uniref:Glycosyltransferase n=1 Tax=Nonomuraea zeae TaxID=1642303 RepID=A0A5S4H535_9ACTN|nr:glycosyltransferase [Nonomuraea zeae]TMR39854.1 glycosyltransferase [Nonomuraea zeae]
MREIAFAEVPLEPYRDALGEERLESLRRGCERVRSLLGGRTVWNVNSTAAGGGVAELLHVLGPLARAAGVDVRWLVLDGDAEFQAIAKRLVSRLYGVAGDGGPLGDAEARRYRRRIEESAEPLAAFLRPGDVVIVHDPQPAGLIGTARRCGASVVWRCHIGSDQANEHTRDGGRFVGGFVAEADATVFSTIGHVAGWAPRPLVIPPSIDPCGPKNMPLTGAQVRDVLGVAGLIAHERPAPVETPVPVGAGVRVHRPAVVLREGPPPPADLPMVVQVSRWDRLKDMIGVLESFVASGVDGYLTLAGADLAGVADDPAAAGVYDECRQVWESLPGGHRRRCQLVCLPMDDLRENAVMVNALQRHASVVVQKSLAEGFGLTATEAMWKSRPLVASAVGGLRDQVTDGETGLLVGDPRDVATTAAHLRRLFRDRPFARRLGEGARRRVRERYLPDRQLLDWARLIEGVTTKEAA